MRKMNDCIIHVFLCDDKDVYDHDLPSNYIAVQRGNRCQSIKFAADENLCLGIFCVH